MLKSPERCDIIQTVVEHDLTPHSMSAEGLMPWTIGRAKKIMD